MADSLFAARDSRSLHVCLADGLMTELDYMTAAQATQALELESALLALAGDPERFASLVSDIGGEL